MQCHGGLKGPLRRIIRSLGNDSVGSSCRSYPQRHRSAREIYSPSPSPPERCSPSRNSRPRRDTLDGTCRQPGAPAALTGRSSRGYTTQCSPPTSRSEPEPNEDAHDDRDSHGFERIGTSPHGPKAIAPATRPSLNDSESETSDPGSPPTGVLPRYLLDAPAQEGLVRRHLIDSPLKDGNDFSQRYTTMFKRALVKRRKKQFVAHQMRQKRHGYNASDDWRAILRMLDTNTVPGKELYRKRLETVKVPEGTLASFTLNAGVSMREIMDHTGCHVQVRSAVNVDFFTGFDLLGSSGQIAHALEILPQYIDIKLVEEIVGPQDLGNLARHVLERRTGSEDGARLASLSTPMTDAHPEYPLDNSVIESVSDQDEVDHALTAKSPVRSVWTVDRTRVFSMSDDPLDECPESISSPLELSAYVSDLCKSLPRVVTGKMPNNHMAFSLRKHVQVVTEKLVTLFADSKIASMATSRTVDLAISFLTKHNNLAAFRELYGSLKGGGYVFTASNWNCCLAAAARAGDVHNYRYTLQVMLRQQVKPDPITWTTFHDLMCRRFPQKSDFVAKTMCKKGLLWDYQAAKLVAQNAVTNDLKTHLAQQGSIVEFFRLYDRRFRSTYGLESFTWLTVDVVDRMCNVLLSVRRTHNALKVLREFHDRSDRKALNTSTLNTFLISSLRDGNPKSAVAMLQHFEIGKPGAIVPDKFTYVLLFSIAWRRRYFNMLRVVWRYACTSGHLNYRLKLRIGKYLNFFLPSELFDDRASTRTALYRAFAAKFAVGVTHELKEEGNAAPESTSLNTLETQILRSESLGSLSRDSPHYEKRLDFFRQILADDISAASFSRPVIPFAELMKAALEKDVEWRERGFGLPTTWSKNTFKEMLEDGIKVPMEAGDGTVENRTWEVPALRRIPRREREREGGREGGEKKGRDDDDGE